MIRNYISSGIPKDRITNVYIPDVYGKEKRKKEPSKEGKLGVEGMSREVLLEAFEKAKLDVKMSENENPVTAAELFDAGITGRPGAVQKRKALLKALNLPENLSTKSMLSYVNSTMTKEEFYDYLNRLV